MERRLFDLTELRADTSGDAPEIVGYAAVFNVLSNEMWGFREKIAPGAFAASVAEDDIRALWQHDTAHVLGRTKSGTLRLVEDEVGLQVRISPPDTQVGRDALALIARGDVDQMSFGFRTLDDEWEEKADGMLVRTLKKVKLYEVSPVTFPAYSSTTVGVRGEGMGDKVEIPAGVLRAQTQADYEGEALRAQAERERAIRFFSYGD